MENELKEISKKLDLLVKLMAVSVAGQRTVREQIRLFSSAGLKPKEIADILGKSPNHISVELTILKRKSEVKK